MLEKWRPERFPGRTRYADAVRFTFELANQFAEFLVSDPLVGDVQAKRPGARPLVQSDTSGPEAGFFTMLRGLKYK
jgi:hypothetical protein